MGPQQAPRDVATALASPGPSGWRDCVGHVEQLLLDPSTGHLDEAAALLEDLGSSLQSLTEPRQRRIEDTQSLVTARYPGPASRPSEADVRELERQLRSLRALLENAWKVRLRLARMVQAGRSGYTAEGMTLPPGDPANAQAYGQVRSAVPPTYG